VKKFGYKLSLAIFMGNFCLTLLLLQFVKQQLPFTILYGGCLGFFKGMTYTIPIQTMWLYFPERKSTFTGIVLFMSAFSGSLLNFITSRIANPLGL
jgi:hypothetical protein